MRIRVLFSMLIEWTVVLDYNMLWVCCRFCLGGLHIIASVSHVYIVLPHSIFTVRSILLFIYITLHIWISLNFEWRRRKTGKSHRRPPVSKEYYVCLTRDIKHAANHIHWNTKKASKTRENENNTMQNKTAKKRRNNIKIYFINGFSVAKIHQSLILSVFVVVVVAVFPWPQVNLSCCFRNRDIFRRMERKNRNGL